ncbi:MAG: GWxTD domain-containing protein [candidate division KSB1 bacterium]|nr:GWxTD domain-containing protein [candidate division KSB1 bacterium]
MLNLRGNGRGGKLLASFLLLWVSAGWAQPQRKLQLSVDYGIFSFGTDRTYLELYYALDQSALVYKKDAQDRLMAQTLMRLNLFKGKELYASKAWRLQSALLDTTRKQEKMVDQLRYEVEPGHYTIRLLARDLNDFANADSVEMEIDVPAPQNDAFSLSSIQLASQITRVQPDQRDIFCKSTLRIIPNPDGFYGQDRPLLYYYIESYHLNRVLNGSIYKTRCQIADANGKPLDNPKPRIRKKRLVASGLDVGNINVSNLPSGTYFLMFTVMDENDQEVGTTSKKFYVYNPEVDKTVIAQRKSTDPLYQYFQSLDAPLLDREYELIAYIVRDQDREIWQSLTSVEAKREFLAAFWRARDPDPKTPENEMREEYFKRLEEANRRFRSYSRDGWRTDRGRVYILYGPPDYIDRYPSTGDTKPYEIWTYNYVPGQGKAEFIFADMNELREFQLIHATPVGEVKNEDWKRFISVIR